MYEQLSRGGQPYDEDAYNVDFVLKPGGGGRGGGGREEEEEAREDARRSEARRVVGELAAETAAIDEKIRVGGIGHVLPLKSRDLKANYRREVTQASRIKWQLNKPDIVEPESGTLICL